MNEQKALELLDLEPGASASEIRRAYQEVYNELQIRLTNAPTEHQKELYRKRLAAVEEAYLFLGGESEEDLSELPSMGPVETAPEEKAQTSKPMSESAALELLGLSKPFSRGRLVDAYKGKKEEFERGFKSAPNNEIKNAFKKTLGDLENAFSLLEPLAESPAPPRSETPKPDPPKQEIPKPQPEKKKSPPLLWAIPVLLLLAAGIWFFLPKGEKQDEISQEVKEEFIKVKSQADLLAEKQYWDQALEKYQEAYALMADAEVQDSITSMEKRLGDIASAAQKEAESKDWATAQRANSTSAYLDFIKKHPSSSYTAQAEQKIKDLESQLRNQRQASSTSTNRSTQTTSPASTATSIPSTSSMGSLPQAIQELQRNMVLVQGGTFTMGCNTGPFGCSDREKTIFNVSLSDYYIGKYEITVAQFKAFIDATNYQTDAEKEGIGTVWNGNFEVINGVNWRHDSRGKIRSISDYNHPVVHISWNDATAFAKWLSRITGKNYRLPTEAEWEFAARGGNKSKGFTYSGTSRNIKDYAWYYFSNSGNTSPVGQKNANELGIFDMSGNVAEWCGDWYGNYTSTPKTNPVGPSNGSKRVIRGGGWMSESEGLRVSSSGAASSNTFNFQLGFRLVYIN
ncbi:SUMF1/EgtB/PvdO family nonheme iron enzyme [Cecembia lonarensis]|uniref:Serine/threonine-protein kinase pkn1 n=1 Tax=Cecembia lonarensis (strain CCUG 58316 / KCTC 22772 / LW9) TaxID=1225176 RepID=K1L3U4_CECL9|nr:SUMF1/EgtB/PvdO family nonheme iron enzyme [Cecembia lonarensis]EKB51120.1 Serine/threonine-protein kinase pkn1 [Cecembia lonarensis LW9]